MADDSKIGYFFLGVGIGVAAGLLLAPQSGEETRGFLKDRADEGKDYLKRRHTELRGSANEALERGKSAVNKHKDQVAAAVEAGKQAYREAMKSAGAGSQEA